MPPVPKYKKEEIVSAAYELARENGMESVVARAVGAKLNTSASPIFTVFKNMDELKNEVVEKSKETFIEYMKDVFDYSPAFKEYGLRWVQFAMDEPQLYRILFNYKHLNSSIFTVLNEALHDTLNPMRDEIGKTFEIGEQDAEELFNQMIIHAHGIACYCLPDKNAFPKEQIGKSLSLVCKSLAVGMKIKNGSIREGEAMTLLLSEDVIPVKK